VVFDGTEYVTVEISNTEDFKLSATVGIGGQWGEQVTGVVETGILLPPPVAVGV